MSAVTVRAAVAADLGAVMRVERAVVGAPYWAEDVYAAMIAAQAGIAVQAGDAESGAVERRLLVAELEGGVVGFAAAKVLRMEAGSSAELESVAVAEDARRRGVGRALCAAAIAWCREAGAETMALEVRVSSQGARALYRGLGFNENGQRPAYYEHPTEDAVLMELKLR